MNSAPILAQVSAAGLETSVRRGRTNSMIICESDFNAQGEIMATVRKTITLTDAQDSWIKAQIESGLYTNDSECIRDLIRREQEYRYSREAIRAALIAGEASGEPQPFDGEAFKQRMIDTRG